MAMTRKSSRVEKRSNDRKRAEKSASAHPLVGLGHDRAGEAPATLERVLFHMLQEYARHVGHIDIVCELVTATVGE